MDLEREEGEVGGQVGRVEHAQRLRRQRLPPHGGMVCVEPRHAHRRIVPAVVQGGLSPTDFTGASIACGACSALRCKRLRNRMSQSSGCGGSALLYKRLKELVDVHYDMSST